MQQTDSRTRRCHFALILLFAAVLLPLTVLVARQLLIVGAESLLHAAQLEFQAMEADQLRRQTPEYDELNRADAELLYKAHAPRLRQAADALLHDPGVFRSYRLTDTYARLTAEDLHARSVRESLPAAVRTALDELERDAGLSALRLYTAGDGPPALCFRLTLGDEPVDLYCYAGSPEDALGWRPRRPFHPLDEGWTTCVPDL